MAGEPWQFPVIPALHRRTQVYTSRRNDSVDPQEYRFTLEDIAAFLLSEFDFVDNAPIDLDVDAADTYEITAPKIVEIIVVIATSNQTIKIGTSLGGSELIEADVEANTPALFRFDQYYNSDVTIHFTGTFDAKIYLR